MPLSLSGWSIRGVFAVVYSGGSRSARWTFVISLFLLAATCLIDADHSPVDPAR